MRCLNLDFPLIRYLKSVVSITSAIDILLQYAHSPRLHARHLSGKELSLNVLSSQPRPVNLPRSLEDWSRVASEALGMQGATTLADLETPPGTRMVEKFEAKEFVLGRVHCECTIALHFMKKGMSEPPMLPYIGCSKLSCLSCWDFLRSLRMATDFSFETKGTHGKVYFPWKYPDVEMESSRITPAAERKISRNLFRSLAKTYSIRLASDDVAKNFSAEKSHVDDQKGAEILDRFLEESAG